MVLVAKAILLIELVLWRSFEIVFLFARLKMNPFIFTIPFPHPLICLFSRNSFLSVPIENGRGWGKEGGQKKRRRKVKVEKRYISNKTFMKSFQNNFWICTKFWDAKNLRPALIHKHWKMVLLILALLSCSIPPSSPYTTNQLPAGFSS